MVSLWHPSYEFTSARQLLFVQKSAGGVLLPKSAVKFERYLMGEVSRINILFGMHEKIQFFEESNNSIICFYFRFFLLVPR